MTSRLSPKAVLAFFYPFIAGLVAIAAHAVVTNEIDTTELRLLGADVLFAAVAALGAYVGKPGQVVQDVGSASDSGLPRLGE